MASCRARASTNQQISEQPHRTGPPARQTTAAPGAGTEELQDGRGGDQWHRTGREDQEETVPAEQAEQSWRTYGYDAGDLASCPGCITGITPQPTEQDPSNLAQCRIRTRAVWSTHDLAGEVSSGTGLPSFAPFVALPKPVGPLGNTPQGEPPYDGQELERHKGEAVGCTLSAWVRR